jgi:hypothetical protein
MYDSFPPVRIATDLAKDEDGNPKVVHSVVYSEDGFRMFEKFLELTQYCPFWELGGERKEEAYHFMIGYFMRNDTFPEKGRKVPLDKVKIISRSSVSVNEFNHLKRPSFIDVYKYWYQSGRPECLIPKDPPGFTELFNPKEGQGRKTVETNYLVEGWLVQDPKIVSSSKIIRETEIKKRYRCMYFVDGEHYPHNYQKWFTEDGEFNRLDWDGQAELPNGMWVDYDEWYPPAERRLKKIVSAGLTEKGTFNAALTKELYDPRNLILVAEFAKQ